MPVCVKRAPSPVSAWENTALDIRKTHFLPDQNSTTDSLHVCIVSETLPPDINGVAMTMGRITAGLRRENHRVDLVYPRLKNEPKDNIREGYIDHGNMTVRGYPIPFYKSMKFGVAGTGTFVKKWAVKRPHIVHIVTEGPLGVAAMSAARKLQIPIVSGFHTNFHQYTGHYHLGALRSSVTRYLRWFHNKCDITLVPTKVLAEELAESGINNCCVLARGVDTELFTPRHRSEVLRRSFGAAEEDPVLLYVGRVAAEKNISLAISAFERFKLSEPRAKLIIVGDGPLLDQVRHHPACPIICGSKVGLDLATHYASADIFLFPSVSETFGNVTLEAMASSLAVVAFNHAAAKEHIHHLHNGIAAPLSQEASYLDATELLARQPALTRKLGKHARTSVLNSDWSEICDRLVQIYHSLLPH